MKYVSLSLVTGFLFIFIVVAITLFQADEAADYTYVGIWHSQSEDGKEFEVSFSDTHLTIDGALMEYRMIQKDDWLFFVTENSEKQSGQIAANEITLLFKVHGRNKMELLSFGIEPVGNNILTRK